MAPESHRGPTTRARLAIPAALALSIIALVAGPPSRRALGQLSPETVRLEGAVYAQGGGSVSSARVRLESDEGDQIWESGLDDQGRYGFAGLRRGVYQLVATADGFETFRETIDLTRTPGHTVIDITMVPLAKDKDVGPPPSLTDARAPRKARKEYQQGMKALADNRLPDAKSHFAKAVKEYPCYARAQTAQALGLISDHDLDGAEMALKKAIDCDAGFSNAYLKLGELYNAELRFVDGEQALQSGLRLEPGLWKFHYNLGAAYYGLGLYSKAEDEYRRSEDLAPPAPPDVHVKLADVYSKERLFDRAYAEMKAYLAADPNGRFAPKVRQVMQEMRTEAAAYRRAQAAGGGVQAPPKPANPAPNGTLSPAQQSQQP